LLLLKVYRSGAIHRRDYDKSTNMTFSNKESVPKKRKTAPKTKKTIRLWKPLSSLLNLFQGSPDQIPKDMLKIIISYLNVSDIRTLMFINKFFYKLLNEPLENERTLFIDLNNNKGNPKLLNGLYQQFQEFLNWCELTGDKIITTVSGQLMLCGKLPEDINLGSPYFLSWINANSDEFPYLSLYWFGELIGFDLPFCDKNFDFQRFKWGKLECENKRAMRISYNQSSLFDFALKDGYLRAMITHKVLKVMNIYISPGSSYSTNPLIVPSRMSNEEIEKLTYTPEILAKTFPVMITIDKCEGLKNL
jgi:hypothetical protein